jgi:hypothetical protein
MPMLASLLYLNDAPTQIASLYVVALTDAGGRMHNDRKLPNLGGFAYPPSCTPNHKKIVPPKKTVPCPRSRRGRAEKSRVVASLWYAATTDAGRRSFVRRRREVERMAIMVGFWRHPICNNLPPRRKW